MTDCSAAPEQATTIGPAQAMRSGMARRETARSDRARFGFTAHLLTVLTGYQTLGLRRVGILFFFVFLLHQPRDRNHFVVAFDIDERDALRGTADRAHVVRRHPQDHALLRDEQ